MDHVERQRNEICGLQSQLGEAVHRAVGENIASSSRIEQMMEEEKQAAEAERLQLFSQIKYLIEEADQNRVERIRKSIDVIRTDMTSSTNTLELARSSHSSKMDTWEKKENDLVEQITASCEDVENRMQCDWSVSDPAIF